MIELRFWTGLTMAQAGDLEGAIKLVDEVVREDPRWLETLRRLVVVDRLSQELATSIEERLASGASRH
jgi:hypothetical protein